MSEKNAAVQNRTARPAVKRDAYRDGVRQPSHGERASAPGARAPQRKAAPGSRPSGSRPNPGKKRRRSKKQRSMLPLIFGILIVLAVLVGGGFLLFGGGSDENGGQTAQPQPTNGEGQAQPVVNGDGEFANLFQNAMVSESDNSKLTGQRVNVTDLSITPGLDESWLNVLLLGADARDAQNPARTDTMIICSINKNTGEVKLSSIMRDTDVAFEGHSSARINSAYYFGGEKLAMKVVNEYFGMNIEHYVYVEFSGFAAIAEILGGIEMDITANEMEHINHNVKEHYFQEIRRGSYTYEEAEAEYYATELKEYGKDIHLNGMQTLGYARIRKLDSDYARAERQRTVLNKLMAGLQNANISELAQLFGQCSGYFRTNLTMNEIISIAQTVLNREDFALAEQMRLPVPGSYKEETRNNDARLYDMDVALNTRELHNFIYR